MQEHDILLLTGRIKQWSVNEVLTVIISVLEYHITHEISMLTAEHVTLLSDSRSAN